MGFTRSSYATQTRQWRVCLSGVCLSMETLALPKTSQITQRTRPPVLFITLHEHQYQHQNGYAEDERELHGTVDACV